MPRDIVFLFPGQSSRDDDMFARLDAVAPTVGTDAAARVRERVGDTAVGTQQHIQCSVFEATLAYLRLAMDAGVTCRASAGLSLGEYAHLVAIGALSIEQARELVAARGRCYDGGPRGVMAAVHPIATDALQDIVVRVCAELGDEEAVAISNYNSPTQCVVAGTREGVERVLEAADTEHFAVGHIIEERVPMHVSRFGPAATTFRPFLEGADWRPPRAEYWPNVNGAPLTAVGPETMVAHLARHVHEPVQWRATIDAMLERFDRPVFVEVGPRQVLTRLASARWVGDARVFPLDLLEHASADAFSRQLEAIRYAATQ